MPDVPNPPLGRWLARLAGLSAADWGRLDAAGHAFGARGFGPMVRRARVLAQLMRAIPGLPPAVVTAHTVARNLWDRATGAPQPAHRTSPSMRPRARTTVETVDPVSRAYYEAHQRRLDEILASAPGSRAVQDAPGAHGLRSVLHFAWLALALAPDLPSDAVEALYAPLESVIPLASLLETPPGAPVTAEAAG